MGCINELCRTACTSSQNVKKAFGQKVQFIPDGNFCSWVFDGWIPDKAASKLTWSGAEWVKRSGPASTHWHTHPHTLLSYLDITAEPENCLKAFILLPLSYSLFPAFVPLYPSVSHTHRKTQCDLVHDKKNPTAFSFITSLFLRVGLHWFRLLSPRGDKVTLCGNE